METFAFQYAQSKGYLHRLPQYKEVTDPRRKESNGYQPGRIHMQDLFDMFAGTSTGSILGTSLSLAYNQDGDR
jgi:hypothetical protein